MYRISVLKVAFLSNGVKKSQINSESFLRLVTCTWWMSWIFSQFSNNKGNGTAKRKEPTNYNRVCFFFFSYSPNRDIYKKNAFGNDYFLPFPSNPVNKLSNQIQTPKLAKLYTPKAQNHKSKNSLSIFSERKSLSSEKCKHCDFCNVITELIKG